MRILLDANELCGGVKRLAERIGGHYGERPLTVVAVMTGSVVLLADLIRHLSMPLRVGVIQASSYRGETTRGELVVGTSMSLEIRGRDVLLVDDIYDTGHTLSRLVGVVKEQGATSVRTAVLLHKKRPGQIGPAPDFVAFEIPDEFVVGYGLDYRDHYRNLPYLAVLDANDLIEAR
jgi:hypoxanthine phosphoribosyltransferase